MGPVLILFLACLALGSIVGVMAGLLGIGGGLIIVPALLFMLTYLLQLEVEHAMPMAIASSLATVIFTGLSSARTHWGLGNINKNIVLYIAIGIALGASVGAYVAAQISGVLLKRVFALLVILLALQMVFGRNAVSSSTLSKPALSGLGLGSGFIASLMGIGGGALLVPTLVWFQTNIKTAIGCSALCGVVIALFGTISFVLSGYNSPYLPAYSLGYVYIPAVIGIVISSVICAPIGARLTAKLDTKKIKNVFAVFLVLVSIRMIIGLD